jgi:hypothetical protein
MKCPLLTMYAITLDKPENYHDRDCAQEECAWYIGSIPMCAIPGIAYELNQLNETIRSGLSVMEGGPEK